MTTRRLEEDDLTDLVEVLHGLRKVCRQAAEVLIQAGQADSAVRVQSAAAELRRAIELMGRR